MQVLMHCIVPYNPLSSDINMHILLTVLHMFHMIPLGRIYFKHQDISIFGDHFIHSHYLYV